MDVQANCVKITHMVQDLFSTLSKVGLHEEASGEESGAENAPNVKLLKEQYQLLLKSLNSAIQRGLESKERIEGDGERVVEIMEFLELDMNWEVRKEQDETGKLREFFGLKMKSFDVDDDIPPGGVYCHSNEPGDGNFFDRQGC